VRVRELAGFLGCSWEGDGDCELSNVAPLENAFSSDLSFVSRAGSRTAIWNQSSAGCFIVPLDLPNPDQRTVIRAQNPRNTIARAIRQIRPTTQLLPGVHSTAVLGPGTVIPPGVYVGPLVSIGAGVKVGVGTSIGAGAVIGDFVRIGEKCTIYPRVTIYDGVTIGSEVVLHSGTVIGADGFGYVLENGEYHNFPQIGRVEIGDRVEIGANSCVDRAALGVTTIGEGTKLDNLVHIGHNCQIGRHVVVAAQTGFSGGVVVEDYAVIGGQVGVGDKARIESGAILGSGSGVLTSKVVRAGQVMWGTPARPLKEYLEQLAVLSRLAKKRKGAAAKEAGNN